MKNRIILCLGCLLAFLQLRAQVNTNQQHLCNPNSFSIVLLGDPQNYVKYDYNQPVFELMTAWTAHHIDSLRVKAVLCTGEMYSTSLPAFRESYEPGAVDICVAGFRAVGQQGPLSHFYRKP